VFSAQADMKTLKTFSMQKQGIPIETGNLLKKPDYRDYS